jgi:cell division protein FtsZ
MSEFKNGTGANIKVIGIGGGGTNAINRMVASGLSGVQLLPEWAGVLVQELRR